MSEPKTAEKTAVSPLNGSRIPLGAHVGNTGCVLSSVVPQTCSHENVVDVKLTGFDPMTGTIVADLARPYCCSSFFSLITNYY